MTDEALSKLSMNRQSSEDHNIKDLVPIITRLRKTFLITFIII